jgi:hypothetical protein
MGRIVINYRETVAELARTEMQVYLGNLPPIVAQECKRLAALVYEREYPSVDQAVGSEFRRLKRYAGYK